MVRVQDHRKNRSDNVEETQTSCKVVDATSMKAFLVTYYLIPMKRHAQILYTECMSIYGRPLIDITCNSIFCAWNLQVIF